jgi:hypothetical protein
LNIVQKNDFDIAFLELFQKHNLIGIVARQAIGRVHIEPIDAAAVNDIAKFFQSRADERVSAVTFIQKTELLIDPQAVLSDASPQHVHLALDGQVPRSLLGTDTCIQRRADRVVHAIRPSWRCCWWW